MLNPRIRRAAGSTDRVGARRRYAAFSGRVLHNDIRAERSAKILLNQLGSHLMVMCDSW